MLPSRVEPSNAAPVRSELHYAKEKAMAFQPGDRVIAESESTQRASRAGTVRQVLRGEPARYRIEWDDGHGSSYTPAAGALHAEPAGAEN